MREILFKAKCKNTKEWIEGFPVRIYDYGGKVWDMHPFETNFNVMCGVIPETICQFTGLKDKNNKKIFEGDIVRYMNKDIMVVVWNKEAASFVATYSAINFRYCATIIDAHIYLEVIGNIYDNPELLEDKNELP